MSYDENLKRICDLWKLIPQLSRDRAAESQTLEILKTYVCNLQNKWYLMLTNITKECFQFHENEQRFINLCQVPRNLVDKVLYLLHSGRTFHGLRGKFDKLSLGYNCRALYVS